MKQSKTLNDKAYQKFKIMSNQFDLNELFRQRPPEKQLPLKCTAWGETITITNHRDITVFVNPSGNHDAGIPSHEDRRVAELIAKAVNNHYQLLEACKHLVKIIEKENEAFYNKHIEAFNIGIETIKNAEQ